MGVEVMQGSVLIEINASDDEITFTTLSGRMYKMYHIQNCCESVYVEDICGDLDDLLFEPLLIAEERIENMDGDECHESATATFYEFSTIKGSVTIRWIGSSNGYYSESVDFEQMDVKINAVRLAVENALNRRKE